ncbi:MAG: 50S ribosomal protein L3 N(5)-glutamine methyltransferase [Gammaproteobacteria bacterium]|nr:50S ribosomal protein L3 N(5)-glutamine methyltransferase [Gammaproteobacteria bacterium]MCI0590868.1 50S ribosomal protein L3 N(5)-glutamine methyltransferase [Gammaproteobacteria bacterium]
MTEPSNLSAVRTPRELVYWGMRQFEDAKLCFGHGADNARDEAVLLVFHALGLAWDGPDEKLDRVLTHTEKQRAVAILQERIRSRKPSAYLTHKAWFAGLPFYVDERVLVPRSPIAELIEERFAPWVKEEHVHCVLDLGTGSGCIAIACALAFAGAKVDAVDISHDALDVAKKNIEQHGVGAQVRAIHSDLFKALARHRYDLIVCNPPYVDSKELARLPDEYQHEPAVGLRGGEGGLTVVNRVLREAGAHLNDGGVLVCEVGEAHGRLLGRYPKMPFLWLEFRRGGEGVFLLTAEELRAHFSTR